MTGNVNSHGLGTVTIKIKIVQATVNQGCMQRERLYAVPEPTEIEAYQVLLPEGLESRWSGGYCMFLLEQYIRTIKT